MIHTVLCDQGQKTEGGRRENEPGKPWLCLASSAEAHQRDGYTVSNRIHFTADQLPPLS